MKRMRPTKVIRKRNALQLNGSRAQLSRKKPRPEAEQEEQRMEEPIAPPLLGMERCSGLQDLDELVTNICRQVFSKLRKDPLILVADILRAFANQKYVSLSLEQVAEMVMQPPDYVKPHLRRVALIDRVLPNGPLWRLKSEYEKPRELTAEEREEAAKQRAIEEEAAKKKAAKKAAKEAAKKAAAKEEAAKEAAKEEAAKEAAAKEEVAEKKAINAKEAAVEEEAAKEALVKEEAAKPEAAKKKAIKAEAAEEAAAKEEAAKEAAKEKIAKEEAAKEAAAKKAAAKEVAARVEAGAKTVKAKATRTRSKPRAPAPLSSRVTRSASRYAGRIK